MEISDLVFSLNKSNVAVWEGKVEIIGLFGIVLIDSISETKFFEKSFLSSVLLLLILSIQLSIILSSAIVLFLLSISLFFY